MYKCILCFDGETKVIETRGDRRRRECAACKCRFTTREKLIYKSLRIKKG